MKIVKLVTENVKKIKAISIETGDASVIKITGKNEQGKTSLLDSILWALKGKKYQDEMPIREGQSKASIELDLGEYTVKRTITDKSNTLTIESKEGVKFKSPQEMLDKIVGNISFDLMEFIKSKNKYDTLKQILGIGDEIEVMENKHKELYDKRRGVNAVANQHKVTLNSIDHDASLGYDTISMTDIADELQEARLNNVNLNQLKLDSESRALNIKMVDRKIEGLKADLEELEDALFQSKLAYSEMEEKIKGMEAIDEEPIRQRMTNLEGTNAAIAKNKQGFQAQIDFYDSDRESTSITNQMDEIKQNIKAMIEEVGMPIDGLSLSDGEVFFNNIPIEQISSSQKLRVSMSIAMALNPTLRVIRITDASLFDSDAMAEVERMAEENDFQVWMEIVDDSGLVGITIEDGEIKSPIEAVA